MKIIFDPSQVSYGQLLQVFFSVAHDPTELDRQGPDTGTQYRSVIFYSSQEQQHIAQAYISQLQQAKLFSAPIVTQVVPLKAFYTPRVTTRTLQLFILITPTSQSMTHPRLNTCGCNFQPFTKIGRKTGMQVSCGSNLREYQLGMVGSAGLEPAAFSV